MSKFHDATFTCVGNLAQNAERRKVGDKEVVVVRVARNRHFRKGANQELVKEVDYWNVDYWKDMSDADFSRLKKGTIVYVKGDPQIAQYSGRDGQRRSDPVIKAVSIIPFSLNNSNQANASNDEIHIQNLGQPAPGGLSYTSDIADDENIILD